MSDMFEYARMTQRVHSNVGCIWPRASLMENHAGAEVRHPPTSAPRPETRNRREEKLTGDRGVRSVREFLVRVIAPVRLQWRFAIVERWAARATIVWSQMSCE